MRFVACLCLLAVLGLPGLGWAAPFEVDPPRIHLQGKFSRVQLVVRAASTGEQPREACPDLTGEARFRSLDPAVAAVSTDGVVAPVGDGATEIEIVVDTERRTVPLQVSGVASTPVEFVRDIRPILNKMGCASAACHASQYGKGGFKLSVVGYDPDADYEQMARHSRQRRINFARPEASLLLLKPTMAIAHGGGRRFGEDAVSYATMREWIRQGAPGPTPSPAEVVTLRVVPARRLASRDARQQLRVEAVYADGSTRDVTGLARFDSLDEGLLSVDARGMVETVGQGQAAVMIRYENQATVATFVVPYAESVELAGWQNQNYVDELAAEKFRELGLEPSPLCDDATFIRRAFLDALGTVPTVEETREFLASGDPEKRTRLVDRLLGLTGDPAQDIYNDRYTSFWTLKWSDLIRNNSNDLGEQGMWALHNWIREAFRVNKPFDAFVRELVTATGSIYSSGPANYFRINRDATSLTESTAQLFLGVRLECAKCHHHPFEAYSQGDYYGLAAFFSRVGTKNSEDFGLFGRETVVMVRSTGDVRHPRTGQLMKPTPLDGEPVEHELDRRIPLAHWLTSPDNPYFARSVANRYVGYLLGRGLVEPIDDMRSTNPPSNEALLAALAEDFVACGYDLKQLMRRIMTSRLYQLRSQPTADNLSDRRFFSHYYVKRLAAEPLLDAVDYATGVPTKFKSLPVGTHAIDLPDAEYPNYFLNTFAKPKRASVCECERSPHENLTQALHTLNGDILAKKLADKDGRVARLLAASDHTHESITRELYLATLSREPTPEEIEWSRKYVGSSPSNQEGYEDLLWALLNSKQFLFVH